MRRFRHQHNRDSPIPVVRYAHYISQTGKSGGIRDALANVHLRKLTIAQFVSLSGDFLAILAVVSVVTFKMHGTPAQVSGILIAYMLPQAFVGPAAAFS